MLLIAGTVPVKNLPMIMGPVKADSGLLRIDGYSIPCTQGTAALISSALVVTNQLNIDPPYALISDDIGDGKGTRDIFQYLIQNVNSLLPKVLVLHYCLPYLTYVEELCHSIESCRNRPFMIADAGAMYAATAAGVASAFDVFTPDESELGFLADPDANHPAYTSPNIVDTDVGNIPSLVSAAYRNESAAKLLLVKGATDYVACNGEIIATIAEPNIPYLEPIGGTGDTITGILSGLIYGGVEPDKAAIIATRTNRLAGEVAKVTPATKIDELIKHFSEVLKSTLPLE